MRRAFIVHGWDGYPEEGWFPWLKKELEARGFEVHVPQLPDAANPRIYNWVPSLAAAVGEADEETYFVGHSMGCQTIARYLEGLPEAPQVPRGTLREKRLATSKPLDKEARRVGGAVFVAGFFKRLTGLESDPEVPIIAEHWLRTPLDLGKVRAHLPKSAAIFSDDDPYVPLDNQDDFRDQLGSEIIIEHGKGHFSGSTGTTELPVALEKMVEMAGLP